MIRPKKVARKWRVLFSIAGTVTLVCASITFVAVRAVADREPVRLAENIPSGRTVVSLVASTSASMSLQAAISDPSASRVSTKGGLFESLEIQGEGVTAQLGQPMLPVVRRLVEIPLGASLSLGEVTASVQERSLPDLGLVERIVPVQPSVPKIPGAADGIPFVIDEEIYGRDEFWPPELIRVRPVGEWRQSHLALVEIFPVRYNPDRGLIRFCSQVDFQISIREADPARTESHRRRYTNAITTRWFSSPLFLQTEPHPQPIEGWSATPVGYLIISADELYEALRPLIDWKRQEGYEVTVAKISQVGQDKSEIKAYIQSAYETWDIPPTFLLLVGDSEVISPFTVGGITTDLYYTTMSEADLFPDIQVGRLAVANSAELSSVVQKIVDHEKALWEVDDSWTRRAYHMATNDSWYHQLAEDTQDYSMHLARAHGMVCDSLYAFYGSGIPISTAVNGGRTMAIYSGHGSWYTWQGPVFSQSDVAALSNGQMYPLVCSHACNTGGFHKPICFGETWLRAEGKGAAAFWGSSVSSYWNEDDILQRRMFEALFDSSLTWLAGMMDRAKMDLWVNYGGEGLSGDYFEQYNLLGDPSMYLWTRPPRTMRVEHPQELSIGSTSFLARVWEPRPSSPAQADAIKSTVLAPVDEALVSVGIDGKGNGLALTHRGVVSVLLAPPFTREGTLEIAVSKRGYRPCFGSAQVKADGPYLLYNGHQVDDVAGGNGNGQIDAGESILLAVTLENSGNEEARGVTADLAEEDPYVSLGRSSASFGDIPAKGSSTSSPPYECHVSEHCPSGHRALFTLTATDNLGQVWTSQFEIQVVAPEVVCAGHLIQDGPPGGNDNGVVEAGETLDVAVILRNDGLAAATGVMARLTSLDENVQVLSDSAAFGDLEPGLEVSGLPVYRVTVAGETAGLRSCPLALDIYAQECYVVEDTLYLQVGTPGFSDDMEAGEGQWTHWAITLGAEDHWHLSQEKRNSGSQSWKCGDTGSGTYFHYENGALVSPGILLARKSALTFWHWMQAEVYDARTAWDGGVVEISIDGGLTWKQIAPAGGYPYIICEDAPSAGSPFDAGTPCYSGYHEWRQEQFDLSAYSGLIQLRFRFGSDQYTEKEGWYIDDVNVGLAESLDDRVLHPELILSGHHLLLIWAPVDGQEGRIRYEVYRADQLDGIVRGDHLIAVVSEPQFEDDLSGLAKDQESVFYAIVAVDGDGRRSLASSVVGRWLRSMR